MKHRVMLACVLLTSHVGLVSAQSLVDVVKKTHEQSEQKPATKSYANADLIPDPTTPEPAPASTSTQKPSRLITSNAAAERRVIGGKDERGWRAGAVALRRQVEALVIAITAEKLHFRSLPETAVGAVGAPIVSAWLTSKSEVSRLQAAQLTAQLALEAYEEEARQANVPPGWLREK